MRHCVRRITWTLAAAVTAWSWAAAAQEAPRDPADEPGVFGDPLFAPTFGDANADDAPPRDATPAPLPPSIPTVVRPRRTQDADPFAAPGSRIGSFVLRGRLDATAGHSDNALGTAGGRGSAYGRLAGEAGLTSDWSRHQLDARISGSFTKFRDLEGADDPELAARLAGRIDVTREIVVDGEVAAALASLDPGDPNTPGGLAERSLTQTLSAAAGVTWRPEPFSVRLGGRVSRVLYDDGRLVGGGTVDNGDRVSTTYGVALRGAYEVRPGFEVFADVEADNEVYDRRVDQNGLERGSSGTAVAAGVRIAPSALVSGEARVGYGHRRYDDPALDDLTGLIADISLAWAPTALTTVRVIASSDFSPTTLIGSSGTLTRSGRLEVEHRPRRNVAVTAALEASRADYDGTGRIDDELTAELLLDWRLNRRLSVIGRAAHTKLDSSLPGEDYIATLFEVGLRLRH